MVGGFIRTLWVKKKNATLQLDLTRLQNTGSLISEDLNIKHFPQFQRQ